MTLDQILEFAQTKKASDIHISVGDALCLRADGEIVKFPTIVGPEVFAELDPLLSVEQKRRFEEESRAVDFAMRRVNRDMRCHLYKTNGRSALALRFMQARIPTMEEVMLPAAYQQIIKEGRPTGLILVTGYTGSGKSTTLAASVDWLNHNSSVNIVTLEHPIEYRYTSDKALIRQREIGRDVPSFLEGMIDAMREDPDVILIGELRDAQTVKAAISAAETGHLVFGTLHTRTAASTISRIFDLVPAEERDQIRTMVASSLLAVIGQRLISKIGGGRVAAFELLVNCPSVAGAIRENKPGQISNEIAVKKDLGMIDFDTSLTNLVRQQLVTADTAISSSDHPEELKKRVGMFKGAAPAAR